MFKEPLFHFLLLALLIFAYFGLVPNDNNYPRSGSYVTPDLREIIIGQHEIQRLQDNWLQTWRRPPTEQQLSNLIESAIKEEIYYREGLRLGLDKNDSVVRNRMVQKMRFLHSEELAEPTQADLQSWLEQNASDYKTEPLYSFQQAYLGQSYNLADLPLLIKKLVNGAVKADDITKPLSMANIFESASSSQITAKFGSSFADSIAADSHAKAHWFGPVISGFGLHLVRVNDVHASTPASLENPATRQRVKNDWRAAERKALEDRIFSRLKQNYTVEILNIE